jgi:hypothetical protein
MDFIRGQAKLKQIKLKSNVGVESLYENRAPEDSKGGTAKDPGTNRPSAKDHGLKRAAQQIFEQRRAILG